MFKKNVTMILAAILVLVFALTGCGGNKSAAPAASGDNKDGAITRGGVLKAAQAAKWSSLDPTVSSGRGNDKFTMNQIYETLIGIDKNGKFVPGLADKWEYKDPKTIVLNLKKGVKFHDGTDFNAEAVKYVLERALKPETKAGFRSEIADIQSIEVIDPLTVKINLKTPSAVILGALSNYAGYMISPAAIQKYGKDIVRNPVGTGPFKMKEAVEGDHITLVKNENYHIMGADGKPLPYLDGVEIKIIPDDSVKLVNLKSGSLDLLDSVQTMNIKSLSQSKDYAVVSTEAGRGFKIIMNPNVAPWNKKEVRQAVAYAVDRAEFVKVVADGYGTVEPFIAMKSQWYYDPVTPYSYNPEKAKELLAKAGYPNGVKAKLAFTSREPDKTIVQLVQTQLKKVGIETEIETFDRLAFNDKWYGGKGDIGLNFASIPKPDPYIQYNIYYGTKAVNNVSGYSNPQFDELMEQVKLTTDTEKRKAILKQAQAVFLEDSVEVILFHLPLYEAYNKKLQGFEIDPEGAWASLKSAWLKK